MEQPPGPAYSRDWAAETLRTTPKTKFLFFWSGKPRGDGVVTESCLSQWFPRGFTQDGITYPTAEHWMMAEKARLFEDDAILAEILGSDDPGKAKALGRHIAGFDAPRWEAARFDIVCRGNLAKFQTNPDLRDYLLRTGSKILVEASPIDTIWGIGCASDAEEATEPEFWPGLNLLGFALMQVRDTLKGHANA